MVPRKALDLTVLADGSRTGGDRLTHDDRKRAAEMARRLQQGQLSWDAFVNAFGVSSDELISELVDLFEHEPKKGGFLGASEREYAMYQGDIERVIRLLETS